METEILIDGKKVKFRATAAVPRLYRIKFRRDIIQDMATVKKALESKEKGASSLPLEALDLFENMAYIMAKHADKDKVPESPNEWLEEFSAFSIYKIFPVLLALWKYRNNRNCQKKTRSIDRKMTTPLLMLRAVQLGIPVRDMELLTIGMIYDMYAEAENDKIDYPIIATQADFDNF